jgi:hypothetical protein
MNDIEILEKQIADAKKKFAWEEYARDQKEFWDYWRKNVQG